MDSEHPTPTPQSPAPVPAFARAAGRAWRTVGALVVVAALAAGWGALAYAHNGHATRPPLHTVGFAAAGDTPTDVPTATATAAPTATETPVPAPTDPPPTPTDASSWYETPWPSCPSACTQGSISLNVYHPSPWYWQQNETLTIHATPGAHIQTCVMTPNPGGVCDGNDPRAATANASGTYTLAFPTDQSMGSGTVSVMARTSTGALAEVFIELDAAPAPPGQN